MALESQNKYVLVLFIRYLLFAQKRIVFLTISFTLATNFVDQNYHLYLLCYVTENDNCTQTLFTKLVDMYVLYLVVHLQLGYSSSGSTVSKDVIRPSASSPDQKIIRFALVESLIRPSMSCLTCN